MAFSHRYGGHLDASDRAGSARERSVILPLVDEPPRRWDCDDSDVVWV